jgi:glycosyltransferase involved in cell wall biosynthesis
LKILAFCFFPAFVPPSNGGQSRLFNFYRSLSKWHEVTLLTSTHMGVEQEYIQHGVGFVERRIPKDNYFAQEYARLETFGSGGDLSGPTIAACGNFSTLLHQAYLDEYEKADVLIHDFPFTVQHDIFAGLDKKPRVYNAHNCEYQLYAQLHPAERSKPIHDLVLKAETAILAVSDLVLYCNDADLSAFRQIAPNAGFASLYAPNGMQAIAATQLEMKATSKRFRAVFMGSGHPPNANAAQFVAHQLAPLLPNVDFDIIGSCLPEGDYPSNVHRHGMVTDDVKHQLLADANLALNPMAAGSGSNVKVLDYFAHGLPVLSTSFGMRGIEAQVGRDYLEAGLEQFAAALTSAAAQPESLADIASNGKDLALENYTWDAICSKVALTIEELTASKTKTLKSYVLALNDYDSFAGIGGGGTRTRGLYTAVSNWSPVVFLSFSDDGHLQTRSYAENITVINVPKTREHLAELSAVNSQFHVSANDIIAARHCSQNPYLSAIYRVLRQNARCIVIEHCYMLALPMSWGDRFVYSSQNHEEGLKRRLLDGHPLNETLVGDTEILERHAVENSAATIAVSMEDAEALVKRKRRSGPVIVVRNGAAAPVQNEVVDEVKAKLNKQFDHRSVVFLGSAHMPNVEAARFIAEKLAKQCPSVHFNILGSVCSTLFQVPRNVKLWGVVDDETKSAVMQSCALAINPMLSGSGSNVKLADYIGNGLYVVTTEFGQRGYPTSVMAHLCTASIDDFAPALERALSEPALQSNQARMERTALFHRELSMEGLAEGFVKTLIGLETKKKRVLYVTYRYVSPAMGGAELNLEKFVSAFGNSGQFDVDVIAPEVSAIHSHWRFGEHYTFDPEHTVPVDIPNVRFARFEVNAPSEHEMHAGLRQIWQAQPKFERAVNTQLYASYSKSGLAWGWAYPEGAGESTTRWAFADCGLHLKAPAKVVLEGYTPNEVVITVRNEGALLGTPQQFKGKIKLEFDAPGGEVAIETSTKTHTTDPRPLGFHVSRILINNQFVDLVAPTMWRERLSTAPAVSAFRILDKASESTRTASDAALTTTRGPWSTSMERFIVDHVAEYDLVIANNNVFRPAVVAMAEAKRQGVPSILIPHAHLDDDFYHFPDWLQSARDASLVLAVPKAACDFLAEKGCNVRYLPAGCDTKEEFTPQDIQAFKGVYSDQTPYILVLGRKAGAKGYSKVIDAVDQLNRDGVMLRVVLIGPDDDGTPVTSPHASYLGRQPRDVVRGALQSCLALCNMSTSESFGIVLLEAWLAGKPVIANKNCAAFHDMAVDNENALLVGNDGIADAISKMLEHPDLGKRFARNGKLQVNRFNWDAVAEDFVIICKEITQEK